MKPEHQQRRPVSPTSSSGYQSQLFTEEPTPAATESVSASEESTLVNEDVAGFLPEEVEEEEEEEKVREEGEKRKVEEDEKSTQNYHRHQEVNSGDVSCQVIGTDQLEMQLQQLEITRDGLEIIVKVLNAKKLYNQHYSTSLFHIHPCVLTWSILLKVFQIDKSKRPTDAFQYLRLGEPKEGTRALMNERRERS